MLGIILRTTASTFRSSVSPVNLVLNRVKSFSTSPASYFPKLKTHSGAKKRWKAISNGSFKRGRVGKVHLNTHKGASRVNHLSTTAYSTPRQTVHLKRLMPYA